jgi:hypothetical protein
VNYSRWRIAAALPIVVALIAPLALGTSTTSGFAYKNLTPTQKRLLSATASAFFDPSTDPATSGNAPRRAASSKAPISTFGNYNPSSASGCSNTMGSNTKVNQDCLNLSDADLQGRAQAHNETFIAQDPTNPNHILASYNDYRRGDGNCYGAYSLNNGTTWTDTTIPMGFTRGGPFGVVAREYWTSGGDTAVAFDTKGNAYFQCQVFQRGMPTTNNADASSAFYVFRSTHNAGASWNFPGRPVFESYDPKNGTGAFEDKPLMTVDNNVGSPFQDRIYVTYTEFAPDGTANIYESYSKDYGETFSARVLVSTTSSLCPNSVGKSGHCDANQFSDPFVGKDGNLYVAWANFNNSVSGMDNHNDILLSKSTNGGVTFSAPVLVAKYYDVPDCDTYQGVGKDPTRGCVPEKGAGTNSYFRVANYPSGAVDPKDQTHVVVSFGSYINKYSQESTGCSPKGFAGNGNNKYTGVKTVCNNKILVSDSGNSGASFNGTTKNPRALNTANQAPAQKTSSQWFQWAAFSPDGRFVTSYYDRAYGNDETTGFMDISVSASASPQGGVFNTARVTSSQMPPPTQFSGTFFGDYTGMSVLGGKAHPTWSDTRYNDLFVCPGTATITTPPDVCVESGGNASVANTQEAMTATVAIP